MTAETLALTDFLLARIAEDEARANGALAAESNYPHFGDTAADALLGLAESEGADAAALLHFGQYRPARVLAECEAKRRIVEAAHPRNLPLDSADYLSGATYGLDVALRALAAVYADHPGYRDEWRP